MLLVSDALILRILKIEMMKTRSNEDMVKLRLPISLQITKNVVLKKSFCRKNKAKTKRYHFTALWKHNVALIVLSSFKFFMYYLGILVSVSAPNEFNPRHNNIFVQFYFKNQKRICPRSYYRRRAHLTKLSMLKPLFKMHGYHHKTDF